MPEESTGNILFELKKSFLEDKKNLQDSIVEAEAEIRQCEEYIKSLSQKDDCDYNVFSPRSANRVYKDQVDQNKQKIADLEIYIKELYKKLAGVIKKLDSLDKLNPVILSEDTKDISDIIDDKDKLLQSKEDESQRIAVNLHDSVLQNLTLILHNLDITYKMIDFDPMRAKLEIESNKKILMNTISDIKDTIIDLNSEE